MRCVRPKPRNNLFSNEQVGFKKQYRLCYPKYRTQIFWRLFGSFPSFFFSRLEFVRFQNAIPQYVSQYPSSKFFKRRISLQDAVRCCRRRPVAVARVVVEVGPALFSPVANPLS